MSYKKIDYTKLNGFGLTQYALDFLQTGTQAEMSAIAKLLGDKVVVYGVEDQGVNVTDGFVAYNGELLPFVGGAKAPKVWVETVSDVELFGDSSLQQVYFTKRLRMGNVGDFALGELKKLKTDGFTTDDSDVLASAKAVKKLYDYMVSMLQFEGTIILSGCNVTNVNNVANTFDLSAGTAMIDSNIVKTAAYSGAFPAYIKPDGTIVNAAPAGSFIKFDPYTSQRYADVLKRATTPVGEIKTFKVLNDRFDVNGNGRWEMLGFKISDDMQSRVPVGYDRRAADPADNVWDANHTMVGNTGGENKHLLSINEMPIHSFYIAKDVDIDSGLFPNQRGDTLSSSNSLNRQWTKIGGGGEGYILDGRPGTPNVGKTNQMGNDEAHNNMQPYRIVVFAERI